MFRMLQYLCELRHPKYIFSNCLNSWLLWISETYNITYKSHTDNNLWISIIMTFLFPSDLAMDLKLPQPNLLNMNCFKQKLHITGIWSSDT